MCFLILYLYNHIHIGQFRIKQPSIFFYFVATESYYILYTYICMYICICLCIYNQRSTDVNIHNARVSRSFLTTRYGNMSKHNDLRNGSNPCLTTKPTTIHICMYIDINVNMQTFIGKS